MRPIDVLFLCETNAAASLIAEALVNHRGDARMRAFSGGRNPADVILPEAREALAVRAISVDALEPKPWSIFALPGARHPDIIVDLAMLTGMSLEFAGLTEGSIVRWPLLDPALTDGDRRLVAEDVLKTLDERIESELCRVVAEKSFEERSAA